MFGSNNTENGNKEKEKEKTKEKGKEKKKYPDLDHPQESNQEPLDSYKVTPEELATTPNEVIDILRSDFWLCLMDRTIDAFYKDASRESIVINGKRFKRTEGYKRTRHRPIEEQNAALREFVIQELFPDFKDKGFRFDRFPPFSWFDNDLKKIDDIFKFWNQGLFGTLLQAISVITMNEMLFPRVEYIVNLQKDEHGQPYLNVTMFDIKISEPPTGEADPDRFVKFRIPGSVSMRYYRTPRGFKVDLNSLECSNSLLKSYYMSNANTFYEAGPFDPAKKKEFNAELNERINAAFREELAAFAIKLSKSESKLKNQGHDIIYTLNAVVIDTFKENPNDPALSIYYNALTFIKKLIENPEDRVALSKLKRIHKQLIDLKNAELFPLIAHVKGLIQDCSPSPFADYMKRKSVNEQLTSNIDKYVSRSLDPKDNNSTGTISRYFNDFAKVEVYDHLKPLVESFKNGITAENISNRDEIFNAWLDLALAYAYKDLFERDGEIRSDIYEALNQNDCLDNLIMKFGLPAVKSKLLSSYMLMIGELTAPEVLLKPISENLDDEPENHPVVIFGQALKNISIKNPEIDKDLIDRVETSLLDFVRVNDKCEPVLKEAILDHLCAPLRKYKPKEDDLLDDEINWSDVYKKPSDWKKPLFITGGALLGLTAVCAFVAINLLTSGTALPLFATIGGTALAFTHISTATVSVTTTGAILFTALAAPIASFIGGIGGYLVRKAASGIASLFNRKTEIKNEDIPLNELQKKSPPAKIASSTRRINAISAEKAIQPDKGVSSSQSREQKDLSETRKIKAHKNQCITSCFGALFSCIKQSKSASDTSQTLNPMTGKRF